MPAPHWLKHAFAIDPPEAIAPNDVQRGIVERLAREVVRRRLTTPALLALEASAPLNFVSAQALHFFHPLVATVTDANAYAEFTTFLEQRGSVDYIRGRIEALEQACLDRERPPAP